MFPYQPPSTPIEKNPWKILKKSQVCIVISLRFSKKQKNPQAYTNKTKRCNLCLHDKFLIIYHPELSSLNKRNDEKRNSTNEIL